MQISATEQKIYQDLMALCTGACGDAVFYFQDFPANAEADTVYRVFNYRLASYTEFMKPSAMEARGIMFEVDDLHGIPLRLASRGPAKFFNYAENPSTIFDYDILPSILFAMNKEDGSLISSYLHCGEVRLKSRGSIGSQQAQDATAWLQQPSKVALYNEVLGLDENGWTVNFEYTSPNNRIVLPYYEDTLTVLSIRNRETGNYMSLDVIRQYYPMIWLHFVSVNPATWQDAVFGAKTFDDALRVLREQTGIEGHVFVMQHADASQQYIKVKNDWYVSLHHTKDSVTNPRRLFECVVDDATDDLRQMFSTDPLALKLISDAENKYIPMYNNLVSACEEFVENCGKMERKEFAIHAQEVFKGEKLPYFSCCMTLYSGKTPDWKAVFKKQYKILGIKDEKVETIE